MNQSKSILMDKSFEFALQIIKTYKSLIADHKEYEMARQLLKSGTSIGANIREARNGESRLDFIHKLSISQKECDETLYWLDLLHMSDYLNEPSYIILKHQATELLKMLRSTIITAKKKI